MTVQLLCLLRLDAMLSRPVCYKTLQLADRNCLTLDAADTLSFTLVLLRTYTSADCRKGGLLTDNVVSLLKIALFYLRDKRRNIDGYRTALHALCIFAV